MHTALFDFFKIIIGFTKLTEVGGPLMSSANRYANPLIADKKILAD
jgi:hypothetical protein